MVSEPGPWRVIVAEPALTAPPTGLASNPGITENEKESQTKEGKIFLIKACTGAELPHVIKQTAFCQADSRSVQLDVRNLSTDSRSKLERPELEQNSWRWFTCQ